MTEKEIKPLTDPAGNPLKNVGVTEDDQKEYLASRPYKAERSALHKGKFARPGHVFLKVKVKWKDREYTNVREFPSADLTQGVMNHLYDKLYEEIKEHHQQQQGIKKK